MFLKILLICVLLIVGLILIIKGGDYFVDGASWVAEASGIPKFIVGATIVSVATTLPEIIVSTISAKASPDMAIGNGIGSVVFNSGVIMAIALIAQPFAIKRKEYAFKGILLTVAVFALTLFSFLGVNDLSNITFNTNGLFGYIGSAVLIAIFIAFIVENVLSAKNSAIKNQEIDADDVKYKDLDDSDEVLVINKKTITTNLIKLIVGAAGIILGAILLKDNAVKLAQIAGLSEALIGVTILAIGTSLPELVTMIIAVKKGQASLSIGNIIGANTIDTALIIPLSTFIVGGAGLPVSSIHLFITMPVTLVVVAIGIIPTLIFKKFARWQGLAMFMVYLAYFIYNIVIVVC